MEDSRIVLGVASDHGHKRESEQDKDEDDLASGEEEFRLTICLDRQNVEKPREEFSIPGRV